MTLGLLISIIYSVFLEMIFNPQVLILLGVFAILAMLKFKAKMKKGRF